MIVVTTPRRGAPSADVWGRYVPSPSLLASSPPGSQADAWRAWYRAPTAFHLALAQSIFDRWAVGWTGWRLVLPDGTLVLDRPATLAGFSHFATDVANTAASIAGDSAYAGSYNGQESLSESIFRVATAVSSRALISVGGASAGGTSGPVNLNAQIATASEVLGDLSAPENSGASFLPGAVLTEYIGPAPGHSAPIATGVLAPVTTYDDGQPVAASSTLPTLLPSPVDVVLEFGHTGDTNADTPTPAPAPKRTGAAFLLFLAVGAAAYYLVKG